MRKRKRAHSLISLFVIIWLAVFGYETIRYDYLDTFFPTRLPKFKLLFPPGGWMMFFQVKDVSNRAEVYGVRDGKQEFIDPHEIFDNHWIGYDNVRRNILIKILNPQEAEKFCHYLQRKFPQYEHFKIVRVYYPSVSKKPGKKIRKVVYEC